MVIIKVQTVFAPRIRLNFPLAWGAGKPSHLVSREFLTGQQTGYRFTKIIYLPQMTPEGVVSKGGRKFCH